MPSLLGSPLPLVAAPMAGGPTTVALAAAVAGAGGFPFLAAGYKSPEQMAGEIAALRGVGAPFGVNLFVPSRHPVDEAAIRAYAQEIAPEAEALDVPLGEALAHDDDRWAEKISLLLADPVPVVSLTFGLPDPSDIAALRGAGSLVLATVTSAGEARKARRAGVDALIVQGYAAGGHSAVHDPAAPPAPISTPELVALVRSAVDLPLVTAGGVAGPRDVRRLLDAGAQAVAVGTLLLLADEAGTSAIHRSALARPNGVETTLTRAFTGRPARALRNGFVERHDATAPVGYPALHHLTRPLRQAAARTGDAERLHLWAGTGYRHARPGLAADLIRWLAKEI